MSDFFVTLWTIACQDPLSMGFSRQEYWSRFPFPPPGDLPDPEMESLSPALVDKFFTAEPPGKPRIQCTQDLIMFVLSKVYSGSRQGDEMGKKTEEGRADKRPL